MIQERLREEYPDLDIHILEREELIVLKKVVVPEGKRGEGIGSDFMADLVEYADDHQKTISLTPSTDFGASSKSRLKRFYKQFGFVENSGRNKDYSISETMYREPAPELNAPVTDGGRMSPTVAAVVPTKDPDRDHLDDTLASLDAQSHPIAEIHVVDSSDQPIDLASATVHHEPALGIGAARSYGAKQAGADVVLHADEDAVLHPEYVERGVGHLAKESVSAAGGPVEPIDGKLSGRFIGALDDVNPSHLGTHYLMHAADDCPDGGCIHTEGRGEDRELRDHLQERGRIVRDPDMVALKDLPTARQQAGMKALGIAGGAVACAQLAAPTLEKLPKGSRCVDKKDVPARSDYWRSDTDTVSRCAGFDTDGTGRGGGTDDGGADGDRSDREKRGGRPKKWGVTWPGDTNGYELVDPEEGEELAWAYHGGREGDLRIYVTDDGEDSRFGRYEAKITGENVHSRTLKRDDNPREVMNHVESFMVAHSPDTSMPTFTREVENAVMKPTLDALQRSEGSGSFGGGGKIITRKTNSGDHGATLLAGHTFAVTEVRLSGGKWGPVAPMHAAAVNYEDLWNAARNSRKSESGTFEATETDYGWRLRYEVGGGEGYSKMRHHVDYRGMGQIVLEDKFGGPLPALTTTGKEFKRMVDALRPIADDGDAVVVEIDDGEAVFYTENNAEERAKATFQEADVNDDSVTVRVPVTLGQLRDLAIPVPKPSSTKVMLSVAEDAGIEFAYVIDEDEANVTAHIRRVVAKQDEMPDYDLSQHLEAAGCLPETGKYELHEPIEPGEPVPEAASAALGIESGDAIVWTFPNSEGCRCGTQAQQFDTLAGEMGVSVYGLAASPKDDLTDMAADLELDNLTLVSDPEAELASEFGVERTDAGLQRKTFFIREGRVIDVSDGVAAAALHQPIHPDDTNERPEGCLPSLSAAADGTTPICPGEYPDLPTVDLEPAADRWDLEAAQSGDVTLSGALTHPGIYVITGQRGAGKSALAMQAAEKIKDEYGTQPVTVGMPVQAREHFPDDWKHVRYVHDAPGDSVLVVDEAYMNYHSRESMSEENKNLGKLINTSRHCGNTMLFVSQNSSYIEKNSVSEADALLAKEPGKMQMQFERMQVRSISQAAKEKFDELGEDVDNRAYVYVYGDEHEGMIQNDLPDWYTEEISKSFKALCDKPENGNENDRDDDGDERARRQQPAD